MITIKPFGFPEFDAPANNDRKRSKIDALREEGTLNPAPEKVRDPRADSGQVRT
jgi:hypothetical protein